METSVSSTSSGVASNTVSAMGSSTSPPSSSSSSFSTSTVPSSSTLASPTPSSTGDPNGNNMNSGSEFGYYYIFIAVFFVIIAMSAYGVHQRRRKRYLQNLSNRRSALARDMQNEQFDQLYANSRRWTGEGRRSRRRATTGTNEQAGAEDGLDEQGEAPPPYKPAGNIAPPATQGDVAVPMQVLHRDVVTGKPPEYHENFAPHPEGRGDIDENIPGPST